MDKVVKFIRAEVRSVNDKDFTIETVISNKEVDRDGDIVQPDAFKKRLKSYKAHPVLLSSHSYNDLRKQIGEAKDIKITDDEVIAKFKYYVGEGNPEADWAWVLAQKGVASFSIGFIGHNFDWITEKDKEGNERTIGRRFTDAELLETSQVLVPSNRGALQLSMNTAKEEVELCALALKSFEKGELEEVVMKPKPKEDESKDDFMGRCVPMLIDEGKEKDQAVAVCSSLWEKRSVKDDDDNKQLSTPDAKTETAGGDTNTITFKADTIEGEAIITDSKGNQYKVTRVEHYSKGVLGEGTDKSTPAPEEDLMSVVRNIAVNLLTKESHK